MRPPRLVKSLVVSSLTLALFGCGDLDRVGRRLHPGDEPAARLINGFKGFEGVVARVQEHEITARPLADVGRAHEFVGGLGAQALLTTSAPIGYADQDTLFSGLLAVGARRGFFDARVPRGGGIG